MSSDVIANKCFWILESSFLSPLFNIITFWSNCWNINILFNWL
jgi:hypothetical protein